MLGKLYRKPPSRCRRKLPHNQCARLLQSGIQKTTVKCILAGQGGGPGMKGKRVALYARVSTDEQTAKNQLRELRLVAERHGWTIVEEFVDHGLSGAKGRDQR